MEAANISEDPNVRSKVDSFQVFEDYCASGLSSCEIGTDVQHTTKL